MTNEYQILRLVVIYLVFIIIPILAFVIEKLRRRDIRIRYFN